MRSTDQRWGPPWVVPLLALVLGACRDPKVDLEPRPLADGGLVGVDAPAEPPGAVALFELPRPGVPPSEFYALPFPNDLRRRGDGTLDLDDHVRPNALIGSYLDVFAAGTPGFGTNAAAFVRFSAAIDLATLPRSPQASREASSSVYLVDVDPDSAERGQRTPLRCRFREHAGISIGPNSLACLPYPGFPLRSTTTYALVVTSRLLAFEGSTIGRAEDLAALFAPDGGDATVVAAREVYAPLLDWLDEPGGDDRDDVVAAAVFTTQDAVGLLGRMREVVWRDVPAPVARDVALDHVSPRYALWEGTYEAPNFQTGAPPYAQPADGGAIVVDADGAPVAQRMERIRFAVAVPVGEMPAAGWPIVLYEHGTGGDYESFVRDGTAGRLADEGLATLSIDAVLHGPRNPDGVDVDLELFNFQNPVAARDNFRQGAADNFPLVRLVLGLELVSEDPEVPAASFDGDRIYFMGHSQGGITAPLFLAWEPLVSGAVLSGAGGDLFLALLAKREPIDVGTLLAQVIRDDPLDEFNNLLALVQMFVEPADPANYAPFLLREPRPGVGAKDIFQSEGFVDHYTPGASIEALAVALGVQPVAPVLHGIEGFDLRGVPVASAPVTANVGGHTGVFLQYEAPVDVDGHFVIFQVEAARRQHAQFLGTLAREGRATLVP